MNSVWKVRLVMSFFHCSEEYRHEGYLAHTYIWPLGFHYVVPTLFITIFSLLYFHSSSVFNFFILFLLFSCAGVRDVTCA